MEILPEVLAQRQKFLCHPQWKSPPRMAQEAFRFLQDIEIG